MFRRPRELVVPLAGLMAALGALTGSASATTMQSFNCRASVVRVAAASAATVEPYVANRNGAQCETDSAALSVAQPVALGGLAAALPGASLEVGPAAATTTSTTTDSALAAAAAVSVSGISIPLPLGAITIAGPVQTTAGYQCVGGDVQASAGSNLSVLQVAGQTITLPSPGAPDTIPLYALPFNVDQIGTVQVNENVTTATSDTETLLNVNLGMLGDIVVGEASASNPTSGACAALSGGGGPGGPSSGNPGSGNPGSGGPGAGGTGSGSGAGSGSGGGSSAGVSGSAGVSTESESMSALSKYVTGGRIYTLAQARRLFHSVCLKGGGSRYVVVGTKGANHITVRRYPVRVLGLGGNDVVSVEGGKGTCVDGGAGNDRITNLAPNRVRVFGGAGGDRIRLGNGSAFVSAGAGANAVTAGTGRDVIVVGHGRNTVTARGKHVEVRAGKGHTVAYLTRSSMPYARAHGVRSVHPVRA